MSQRNGDEVSRSKHDKRDHPDQPDDDEHSEHSERDEHDESDYQFHVADDPWDVYHNARSVEQETEMILGLFRQLDVRIRTVSTDEMTDLIDSTVSSRS